MTHRSRLHDRAAASLALASILASCRAPADAPDDAPESSSDTSGSPGEPNGEASTSTSADETTAPADGPDPEGEPMTGGDSSGTSDASTTSGDIDDEPVTVLNGGFESTDIEPGCYANLSNEEFGEVIHHVVAFGALNQIDLYDDCYATTSEGVFHIGLGSIGRQSDAVALELSGPLDDSIAYELSFVASYGATGGSTSTIVEVGASEVPDAFGTTIGETELLTSEPTRYTFPVQVSGPTYITLQVVPDGDLGWAMLDDVELVPL